jgi:hypothetical protein
VLGRLAPPSAAPVRKWVTQPWRLVQDPKAPPLHITPARSSQLQHAVLSSLSDVTRTPLDRCQALLACTVSVSFGVRTNLDLDGGETLVALRSAFGRIVGGFAPSRIGVRLLSPTQAVLEAGAAHLVVLDFGQPRGHHRRALGQRERELVELPEKQVWLFDYTLVGAAWEAGRALQRSPVSGPATQARFCCAVAGVVSAMQPQQFSPSSKDEAA